MTERIQSQIESKSLTEIEIEAGTLCHRVWEAIPNGKGTIGHTLLLTELAQLIADRPGALEAFEKIQSERSLPIARSNGARQT